MCMYICTRVLVPVYAHRCVYAFTRDGKQSDIRSVPVTSRGHYFPVVKAYFFLLPEDVRPGCKGKSEHLYSIVCKQKLSSLIPGTNTIVICGPKTRCRLNTLPLILLKGR